MLFHIKINIAKVKKILNRLLFLKQTANCTYTSSKGMFLWGVWITDKRTDVWSRNFIIWEINFGLLAVAWAAPWEKGVWADSEQLFWEVFSIFHGQKN